MIRKACEALSLLSLSVAVFRGYFMSLAKCSDTLAIALAMYAVVWNDRNPGQYRQGFNAFVLGLLWFKVLGFLQVVNKQMATFILALIQIVRDIRYFAIVLLVVILAFGDMVSFFYSGYSSLISTADRCIL